MLSAAVMATVLSGNDLASGTLYTTGNGVVHVNDVLLLLWSLTP